MVLVALTNILCLRVKAESNTHFLLGDSDGDNDVTVIDATLIQRDITQIQLLDIERYIAADTDCDGLLTVIDSSLIQRWLADIQILFPIGESVTKSYLDTGYQQLSPTEPAQTTNTAKISADGKTAIAYKRKAEGLCLWGGY